MTRNHGRSITFREVQSFRQGWLWALLLASDVVVVLVFGYGMIQQLILGVPWGDRPMSDLALMIVGPSLILFVSLLVYLFAILRLITEVAQDGLHLRFYPLRRMSIPYASIKSCEVRSYRPIREYGGWGIKFGPGGRALNVSGNRGVQLELEGEKPLLIGSQKAEQLALAIKSRMK